MSESIPTPDNTPDEVQEPKPTLFSIELWPDGRISVNGPLYNKVLCYGMLEAAKDAVSEMHQKDKKNRIVPPDGGIMNFLRNGKR